ncbi:rRNA pseudouridine synthase [Nitrosomonas sp.]|uniref:pseudouridine synthase n=1 Tax=Nitrosomonas sp. TaxID=42353 RepID=UPI0025E42910|nr:rRNA pseudouridine synthase [Nitrosomonas sp.]MCC6917485.1 rRNA pseudouridine synthase [Nitrosomonas sp.]
MEKIRLSKLMSAQGMCSRREADVYIEQGWVYVDGQQVRELGTKVYSGQKITLNRAAQEKQNEQVTIFLNKPVGYVSGQPEPGYKPAVSLINHDSRFQQDLSARRFSPQHLKNLAPAGRLDIDSQGLLVFTQDGRIAKQLIGEHSQIEKEYLVRVAGNLTREGLALLNHGLRLDGQVLKPAKVSWLNQDQLRFVLQEGKKRQIRRMCELVGLNVIGLKRVRIGKIRLSDLPEGKWRYLGKHESFE